MGGGIGEDRARTETAAGRDQQTFYYNGIGTRDGGTRVPLVGRLYAAARRAVNMTMAPSFSDAGRILDEACRDFEAAYTEGDRVVVFGFSRGAP